MSKYFKNAEEYQDYLDDNSEVSVELGVRQLLQKGRKLKIYWGEKNMNNKTIHIRAIVDDDIVVYKFWLKRKKYWTYKTDNFYYFGLLYKDGILKVA